jgi:ATP-dependent DNA ligase
MNGCLFSRTKEPFIHFNFIIAEIKKYFPENIILDGELFTDSVDFDTISGIVRKKKNFSEEDLQNLTKIHFNVFDIVELKKTFEERKTILDLHFKNIPSVSPIKRVNNILVKSHLEIETQIDKYIDAEYEGIMVKNTSGMYKEKYRSEDLLKYKKFFDSEFKIVGTKVGSGIWKKSVIWECSTKDGLKFFVVPDGTQKEREKVLKMTISEPQNFINKMLTVRYQNLNPTSGIPIFPKSSLYPRYDI